MRTLPHKHSWSRVTADHDERTLPNMSSAFTKSTARNIFYGGAVFFFLLFLAMTFDTMQTLPKRDNRANLTESVARGKHIWETRNCIGCHTLMGEGACLSPEPMTGYTLRGPRVPTAPAESATAG